MTTQSLRLISRGGTPDVKSTGMIGWRQKSAAKQIWLNLIRRTARPGYAGTTTDCFENPKNSLLKLNHPKNTCQIFLPPPKSWNQKFECPKNPYPSGGRSSVHSSKVLFPWVKMLSARYWGGGGGRWGTRLGQQNSKIYITCLRQDYLFYYPV